MQAFTYDGPPPADYKCGKCKVHGLRLWRQYQTCADAIDLLCVDCAELDQKKKLDLLESDSIGWLVPAVPTEDGETFWGYTSVPEVGVFWWRRLQVRPFTTLGRDLGVAHEALKHLVRAVGYQDLEKLPTESKRAILAAAMAQAEHVLNIAHCG